MIQAGFLFSFMWSFCVCSYELSSAIKIALMPIFPPTTTIYALWCLLVLFEGWRLRTAECASYVWIVLSVLHLAQSSLITVYCLDCIITTLFENLINWYHNVLKIEPLFRLDGTSKFVKRLQNDINPQVIKLPPQI